MTVERRKSEENCCYEKIADAQTTEGLTELKIGNLRLPMSHRGRQNIGSCRFVRVPRSQCRDRVYVGCILRRVVIHDVPNSYFMRGSCPP